MLFHYFSGRGIVSVSYPDILDRYRGIVKMLKSMQTCVSLTNLLSYIFPIHASAWWDDSCQPYAVIIPRFWPKSKNGNWQIDQGEVKWWQKAVEFVNWTLLVRRWNLTAMHQKCDEIFQLKWRITICENMYKRLRQFILWMLWYFMGWEILDLLGPLNQIQGTLKVCNEFLSNPSNVIFQFGTKREHSCRVRNNIWIKGWYLKAL